MNLESRVRKLERSLPPRTLSPREIYAKYCPNHVWYEELDLYGNLYKAGRPAWTIPEDMPEPTLSPEWA